jgi:hypothetical protein
MRREVIIEQGEEAHQLCFIGAAELGTVNNDQDV